MLPKKDKHSRALRPKPCTYCKVRNSESLLFCDSCSKWYCADPVKGGCHFAWHLDRAEHYIWSSHSKAPFHRGLFSCKQCCSSNMSMLCLVNNSEILCRLCAIKIKTKNEKACIEVLISNGNPLTSVFGESTSKQLRDIRQFDKRDLGYFEKRNDENRIFFMPLETIKKAYIDVEDYRVVFRELLLIDMECEKKKAEEKCMKNISITINDTIGYFYYDQFESSIKLNVGSPITIYLKLNPYEIIFDEDEDEDYTLEAISDAIVTEINPITKKVSIKFNKKSTKLETRDDYIIKIQFIPLTFQRMLNALEYSEQINRKLKFIILGINMEVSRSDIDQSIFETPPSDWIALNLKPLNESQLLALKTALMYNLSIIQGPPGTGKTQLSAVYVWKLSTILKKRKDEKILVTSKSNIAVDNLVERIHKTGLNIVRVTSKIREIIKSSSEIVHQNSLHILLKNYIKEHYPSIYDLFKMKYSFDELLTQEQENELNKVVEPVTQKILEEADVICCTNVVTAGPKLKRLRFPYVLIDEASQSIEPETLLPLIKGCKHLVLIGDQVQLGPMSKCMATKKAGLDRSLMVRLIDLGLKPILLKHQYRMHPCISEFPRSFFYLDQLSDDITSDDRPIIKDFWPNDIPNVFFHNQYNEASTGTKSVSNVNEGFEVLHAIKQLKKRGVEYDKIVILTAYEAQKKTILEITTENEIEIKVMNIDEFQGNEEDYVIFSTVRSNIDHKVGFLQDSRRLNVAITRAKYGLIIFGDCETLGEWELWKILMNHYSAGKMLFSGNIGRPKPYPDLSSRPPTPPPAPAPKRTVKDFEQEFKYSDEATL